MDGATETLWFPTVGGYVLATAALVTVATLLVQVRRLADGVRGWWGGKGKSGAPLLLAGSASMGSITGAVLAVTLGGPGALVWMWLTTLAGMALHFAEASLTAKYRADGPRPFAGAAGSFGGPLAGLLSLGIIVVAVLFGGLFQTQQAALLMEDAAKMEPVAAAGLVGLLGGAIAFAPKLRRAAILYAVPAAVALVVTLGGIAALQDTLLLSLKLGDAFNQAFGVGAAATGTAAGGVGLLVFHGVLRAVMAGEIGLGAAAMAEAEEGTQARAGATAMLVPLVTNGLVGTATALALLSDPGADIPVAEPTLLPLERHESRGLRPSKQVGQTIVLPDDTPLQNKKFYAMRLRANPRGHPLARLERTQNVVTMPPWTVGEGVDTVMFRSRDKARARQPGWDVRIPVDAQPITDGVSALIKLTPKDPEVDFGKLIGKYELDPIPFVNSADFQFVGKVGIAASHDDRKAEHLAMYEPEGKDRPPNPKLHEFFRGGYRGPYADQEGERPPWGLVAKPGLQTEVGARLNLALRADPRGDDFVRVNRVGGVEGPLWDFLLQADTLIVRHEDPAKDIRIPVTAALDGWRIRFKAKEVAWEDFRKIDTEGGYSGPYVVVPDFEFEVEVHTDTRLPNEKKERYALVPVHAVGEPVGPLDGAQVYAPHPGELLEAGMSGPFLSDEGVQRFVTRVRYSSPTWGPWMLLLAGVVLAATSVAVWSAYAARSAHHLAGHGAGKLARFVVVGASLGGGAIAFGTLLPWVELAFVLTIVPNLAGIVLLMSDVRQAAGESNAGSANDPDTDS